VNLHCGVSWSPKVGRSSRRLACAVAAILAMAMVTGCSSSTKPGNLSRISATSSTPRYGNTYLLRGWIGIFSSGIDSLGRKLDHAGVHAHVFQEDQWRDLAAGLVNAYRPVPPARREPLVLIGHSYGADSVVRIAHELAAEGIQVDLLVTLDPVTPPDVPANVRRVHNLYQSNGPLDNLPWLRGIPLKPAADFQGQLRNMDIRVDRRDLLVDGLDHFNIEKQPRIHTDVVAEVLKVCPARMPSRPPAPAQPSGEPR
jgi:pimeloyl-ACP methyl ester carboxylesterase